MKRLLIATALVQLLPTIFSFLIAFLRVQYYRLLLYRLELSCMTESTSSAFCDAIIQAEDKTSFIKKGSRDLLDIANNQRELPDANNYRTYRGIIRNYSILCITQVISTFNLLSPPIRAPAANNLFKCNVADWATDLIAQSASRTKIKGNRSLYSIRPDPRSPYHVTYARVW